MLLLLTWRVSDKYLSRFIDFSLPAVYANRVRPYYMICVSIHVLFVFIFSNRVLTIIIATFARTLTRDTIHDRCADAITGRVACVERTCLPAIASVRR